MKILFILNGSKPKAKKIPAAIGKSGLSSMQCTFVFTKQKGHAIRIAEEVSTDIDIIVPVGGDGTTSECINGLMRLKEAQSDRVLPAVAPWPMGSGNDFARNFNWKNSIENIGNRIKTGKKQLIDVGCMEGDNSNVSYFINEMSFGLGPAVVRKVETLPSWWNGHFKFGIGILMGFASFKKKEMKIAAPQVEWQGKAMAIVVANGKYFGSGIGIAPSANPGDGVLDLTIIGNISLFDYLRYLGDLKKCRKILHREVHYHTIQRLSILSGGSHEADGEIGPGSIQSVYVIPQALEFL